MARYIPGSKAHRQAQRFNRVYTKLLKSLDNVFNGQPDTLKDALGLMFSVDLHLKKLVHTPIADDGDPEVGPNAAPTFDFTPWGVCGCFSWDEFNWQGSILFKLISILVTSRKRNGCLVTVVSKGKKNLCCTIRPTDSKIINVGKFSILSSDIHMVSPNCKTILVLILNKKKNKKILVPRLSTSVGGMIFLNHVPLPGILRPFLFNN